ncbi:hypothetical protein BC940DRAFT_306663 [Gongronella butleri]|nr:hypothetical protein BC940DRAFT_306663 [Gongronella butleri]
MKVSFALIATFISTALAFEDTVPCLLWSSNKEYLSSPSEQLVVKNQNGLNTVLHSLSSSVCDSKRIAVIDQLGLHRSDLGKLDILKNEYLASPSSSHYNYIAGGVNAEDLVQSLATQCNAQVSQVDPAGVSNTDTKVLLMTLPAGNLQTNELPLKRFLTQVQQDANNDYVVIYTSSQPKPSSPMQRRAPDTSVPSNNSIFAKYQLFTPAIFMCLAVAFLFIFIAGVGLTWLFSITTPARLGETSKQKKN